jgi:uroporphyrinogen III methyltransferase / synthase
MNASVFLIGAGPGDPGLLTLRGAELLARADVVLYDALSNAALLKHASSAEQICVGKHGQSRIWRQEEIIDEMIRHARSGRIVARLKGGDPAVFARTAEEAGALRAAGIDFEIVPGITAALAAASYAGIPITHRGYASAVALVTGHEEPEKSESALDWNALAQFPGTLVIYMGVTTAKCWTNALIQAGKPAETPAAILRRCSLPDQQTIHCRLQDVAEHLTPASRMRPPVIVIVGEVARPEHTLSWFDTRPLFGTTVLVTRAAEQADELSEPLLQLGAEVLTQPAIEIAPLSSHAELDHAIAAIDEYDYLVFSSRNGVRHFMDRWLERRGDVRGLAGVQLAVVGARTADALAAYHLQADVQGARFTAESLATILTPAAKAKRFLLIRASRGAPTLEQRLSEAGGHVSSLVAYQHRDVAMADESIMRRMADGEIDWLTVTSDAVARSVVRLFGDRLHNTQLASLSSGITETLKTLGYHVTAQAAEPTMKSLVEIISATAADKACSR